jgi:hypothetical protein
MSDLPLLGARAGFHIGVKVHYNDPEGRVDDAARPKGDAMSDTSTPGTVRPRYFQGQLLTEKDFSDEQDYFREKLRRHNRLMHGWGVVCGLRVTPAAVGCTVVVSPGYALDPCGDEILLDEEALLRLPGEGGEDGDPLSRPGDKKAACPDGAWVVEIRHVEIPVQMVPAMGGSGETGSVQPSRIRETCELRLFSALPPGDSPARERRGTGAPDICPPCPPDPDERWVVLAEVQGGRVVVKCISNASPGIPPGQPAPGAG